MKLVFLLDDSLLGNGDFLQFVYQDILFAIQNCFTLQHALLRVVELLASLLSFFIEPFASLENLILGFHMCLASDGLCFFSRILKNQPTKLAVQSCLVVTQHPSQKQTD